MALPQNAPSLAGRPHILVVDDDARICDLVSRYLKDNGFVVVAAQHAAEAREMLEHFEFDAMVVDVMMPGETGLEFTRSVRGKLNIPVLLLTALGEIEDKVTGLDAGADDYLAKPFEPRELVARINAILRRTAKKQTTLKPFKLGKWRFDPDVDELNAGEEKQRLTSVEARLLRALAGRAGEAMSRDELAKICEADGERTIDVQVTRLRRKIEEDSKAPRYLQTVRGKGYMLRIEDA
jgi:two-component system phosphate regulon response regulator OmpR